MTNDQLKNIRQRFDTFAKSFLCDDDFTNSNLNLKLCHSYNVPKESEFIANELKLPEDQTNLAIAIGLVHDIGRFPQFAKYKTYTDHHSINHSQLGAESIIENKVIADIPQDQQDVIITAVKYHGVKEIPADITGDALLHTQIIRDADKIDIYKVVINLFDLYRKDPEKFPFEIEFPENDQYSAPILDALIKGQQIDYSLIDTMNDARLLQIAWVFDTNFAPSLKRIQQKGYIDKLFDYFPDTPPLQAARKHILNYMTTRIDDNT